MLPETQAQVFIKTLVDMLNDQREKRSLRLQRQNNIYAERVFQSFRNVPVLARDALGQQAELDSVGTR